MAKEEAADKGATRGLDKRVKILEGKVKRLQSRVGGVGRQTGGGAGPRKAGRANLFEKFGWITFPSSWYVGDWGIADITDTPRYQVMGGLVVLRILIARGTADTTSFAIQMDLRIAPSRNMYTSTLCGSSLDVVGNANVGAGGRVDIYGPYPESNTQTFIHIIYPYEP